MRTWLILCAGALPLLWPALANGYPILFGDTAAFLDQAMRPWMLWDKPWGYGALLLALDGATTLWLPAIGQALLASHVLWLVQKSLLPPRPWRHAALCVGLAACSAAPWVASLLMPDIFAPLVVLCLFLLGFGQDRLTRPELWWAGGIASVGIAVHLSHLIVAAACLVAIWALRRRITIGPAVPLAASLIVVAAGNLAGHGRLGIAPFGSVFALARLQADGPARQYLRQACPDAGYSLCDWLDRMPADSEAFLWDPDGPVWAGGRGPIALSDEAAEIVVGTVLGFPLESAGAALDNTAQQLGRARLGDTLHRAPLETIGPRLARWFPPEEGRRFAASLQAADRLAGLAAPLWPTQGVLLAGGFALCLLLTFRADVVPRRRRRVADEGTLAALALTGVAANAFATGALSGPADRYGARIAWILLLPPALALLRLRVRPRGARPPPGIGGRAARSPSATSP